jgi:hypothetical protein
LIHHHTLPDFKLEVSKRDAPLTSFGGLLILRRALKTLGLIDVMKTFCLKKAGYADAVLIEAIILLLASGGHSLSDWDYLSREAGFERLFGYVPSVDSLERYLRRLHLTVPERAFTSGQVGYTAQLQILHEVLIRKAYELAGSPKTLTADIDTTITHSDNREALFAYDGERGYQPMLVYCPELSLVIAHEFRDGNPSPQEGYDRLFDRCRALFPGVTWAVRSDAAGYQLEWLDTLGEHRYYVTAKQCETMFELLKKEASWKPLIKDGVTTDQEVAEIPYVASFSSQEELKQRRHQRFIAVRKKRKQMDIWEGEYVYHVMTTNDPNPDLGVVLKEHWGRCGSIEFANSEIKSGCGMGHMPSNDFKVNAAWFSLGVLTHNLLRLLQRHVLPKSLEKVEIQTLRFRFLRLAVMVIKKARRVILRFSRGHPAFVLYAQAWTTLQTL